jgi:23S rRNA (adenine2503-C2)-methyltransferase
MKQILSYTLEELSQELQPAFRAKQVYNWLYTKYVDSFDEMKNIPKELKEQLNQEFVIEVAKIVNKEISSDGSVKYLFELPDGHTVETVLLDMKKDRYTVCVSTQVGCKVGCSFCLTAKGGFVRNLEPSEIVAQITKIKQDNNFPSEKRLNIVYMGMGEPLDNFDNLVKAIGIFKEESGLAISPKRQTVSTSGISNKINRLGELDLGVHIAISLHAVDDKLRSELIPLNKAYNIKSIIDAIKEYPYDNRKRVMFEYLVMKGLNDSIDDAKKLVKLLNGIKAKVNLIYYNPYEGGQYERPTVEAMEQFQSYLNSKGLLCTIRASRGIDISAACGQLREKNL